MTALFGDDIELSPEIAQAMQKMYALGRKDTLDYLGITEEDLPSDHDMVAWSA